MNVCKVHVEVIVDEQIIKTKTWPTCDIMKTGVTRAWATRQFNAFLKDFNDCVIGKDKIIVVRWTAEYGETNGFSRLTGLYSGVNGKVMARRGIFER